MKETVDFTAKNFSDDDEYHETSAEQDFQDIDDRISRFSKNISMSAPLFLKIASEIRLVRCSVVPSVKDFQKLFGMSYYAALKWKKLFDAIPTELPFGNITTQNAVAHLVKIAEDIIKLKNATLQPMSEDSEYLLEQKTAIHSELQKNRDSHFKADDDRKVKVSEQQFDYEAEFSDEDLKNFIPDDDTPTDDDFVMPDYLQKKS